MIKVLMLSQWYPLSMSRYMENAFSRRSDVELRTIGPYTGTWIPWLGGMNLPSKYAKSPYYPIFPNEPVIQWTAAKAAFGDWIPDVVVTVDAGVRFSRKPDVDKVVHVATDPHALNYDIARKMSDYFFNMQACYSKDNDIYLPYAFDPKVHYPVETEKIYDGVSIGMPYERRAKLIEAIRGAGHSVFFENGPIFDEYRQINNQGKVGINYSSLDDLNARAFELMAMKMASYCIS